jgi:hypothetical protein
MAAVNVMQVSINEVVGVIAVRDGLMAAARDMFVVLGMTAAIMGGRAIGGILAVDR